jgi:formamidopyrimidine-DNA glycosylase
VPELPEVETVKRGLEPALLGQRFARVELRRKDLRFPFPVGFAARLTGARVEALERRAKYILVHLDTGESLVAHLGMTGRFTVLAADGRVSEPGAFYHEVGGFKESPHDHVLLVLENGTRIIYNDARRFGFMDVVETARRDEHKMFRGMGVEPLGNSFNAEHLAEKFVGKSAPLKAALLDQRVVAGLGNIYVSEALFRAGLSPKRKAGTLVKKSSIDVRMEPLVRHIKDILNEAIRAGGSTLQDFQHADGSAGSFQQRFKVYDLAGEPCPNGCGHMIKRLVQAGRSSFYCSHCQK